MPLITNGHDPPLIYDPGGSILAHFPDEAGNDGDLDHPEQKQLPCFGLRTLIPELRPRSCVPAGGRILQLPLVQAEDAGRYSCKASNEVGEDWLHYELLVLSEWPGGAGRRWSQGGLLLKGPGEWEVQFLCAQVFNRIASLVSEAR